MTIAGTLTKGRGPYYGRRDGWSFVDRIMEPALRDAGFDTNASAIDEPIELFPSLVAAALAFEVR